MKISIAFALCLFAHSVISAEAVGMLYNKNYCVAQTASEKKLVKHAMSSYERAMRYDSKLHDAKDFSNDRRCNSRYGIIPYYHLLNNLCALKGAFHLHIGLYSGGSFVSALYENENIVKHVIGIDWYIDQEGKKHKETCFDVCDRYLEQNAYQIIIDDCFAVDLSSLKNKVNIYLYDADHSIEAHTKAFTYYDPALAHVFITVIDDWSWEEVRQGTFDAFDQLSYGILYETVIPGNERTGNGQYLAVIKKMN